jgi:hypothetical protein
MTSSVNDEITLDVQEIRRTTIVSILNNGSPLKGGS